MRAVETIMEIPNPENITIGRRRSAARKRRDIKRVLAVHGYDWDSARGQELPYLHRLARRHGLLSVIHEAGEESGDDHE